MKLKKLLKRIYASIPPFRELIQIRDAISNLKYEQRKFEFSMLEAMASTSARYNDPKRLLRYGLQCNSQNLEDGMTCEIFRRIGTTNKTFAEIGVGDGKENNTAMLLAFGWSGYWFDGDSAMHAMLNSDKQYNLKAKTAFVNRENVACHFSEAGVPIEPDLLSLDVDQNTYYIWEGLSQWKPRVVIVEYNAAIPPDQVWKVKYDPNTTWNGTQNFGASLKAFENLGTKLGYSLVGCDITGINAFFVRSDLVGDDRFCKPFSAENHYEPPRYAHGASRRMHSAALLDRVDC